MSVSSHNSPERVEMTEHQRRTLLVTCVGAFMVLLDVSIVNTALPSIQRAVGASFSGLQWVVDAYTLAFAVVLLSAGSLADRYGRKRAFQIGMAVFSIGSLLCGFADSGVVLDAARAIQGLGGAALATSSLALLATAFTDARERIRAISLWAAISGLALGVGPTLGGAIVTSLGWRWVFFLNVPIGVVCLALGVRVLTESRDPAARRVDAAGQLLSIAGLAALTYGFIERGSHGWSSAPVAYPLVLAVVVLTAFLVVEHRSNEPMLPLALFRHRLFAITSLVTFLVGFVLISVPFFIVQFLQDVKHLSAFAAGCRVLAFTLMFSLSAPFAGRLARRYGPRVPVTIGALAAASGLVALTEISVGATYADMWWRLALVGFGFGLMLSPLSSAALAAVDPRRSGLASSVANTNRQVGTVIGIALLGALVQSRATSFATSALHGLPTGTANRLGSLLGHGGAGGSLSAASLPTGYSLGRLRLIAAHAYVSGIRSAFLVDAIVLFVAAIIAATLLRADRGEAARLGTAEPESAAALVA